jgi:RNA polymerase sigma factor (sigma-70 family)
LRRFVDGIEMREELEGEIYCRFRQVISQFDPRRGIPFRPYVVRMLTASVYTYARQRWIRTRREVSYDGLLNCGYEPPSDDPTGGWDCTIDGELLAEGLPHAIGQLSNRQRSVLVWRYYEGRTFAWIAERLQIKEATVRSLLRHAIARLRKLLIVQKRVNA